MKRFKLVQISIIATTIAILVYDGLLMSPILGKGWGDWDNSISSQLYTWSLTSPALLVSVGVLIGHLFFPAQEGAFILRYPWLRWGVVVVACGLAFISAWLPYAPVGFAIALLAGRAGWPNKKRSA